MPGSNVRLEEIVRTATEQKAARKRIPKLEAKLRTSRIGREET
jgi:hypothetical protein